jgi:hypothetical protein
MKASVFRFSSFERKRHALFSQFMHAPSQGLATHMVDDEGLISKPIIN